MASPLDEGKTVDGKKEGKWTTYYANGNKRSQGTYKAGLKHGKWTYYHKNGQKSSEGRLRDNKHEGKWRGWYDSGELEGELTYRKHDGSSYDGKKEGPHTFYNKDGTVWRVITYKNGRRAKDDEFPNPKQD